MHVSVCKCVRVHSCVCVHVRVRMHTARTPTRTRAGERTRPLALHPQGSLVVVRALDGAEGRAVLQPLRPELLVHHHRVGGEAVAAALSLLRELLERL